MCTFENVASIGSLLSQDKIFPLHTIDNIGSHALFPSQNGKFEVEWSILRGTFSVETSMEPQ